MDRRDRHGGPARCKRGCGGASVSVARGTRALTAPLGPSGGATPRPAPGRASGASGGGRPKSAPARPLDAATGRRGGGSRCGFVATVNAFTAAGDVKQAGSLRSRPARSGQPSRGRVATSDEGTEGVPDSYSLYNAAATRSPSTIGARASVWKWMGVNKLYESNRHATGGVRIPPARARAGRGRTRTRAGTASTRIPNVASYITSCPRVQERRRL